MVDIVIELLGPWLKNGVLMKLLFMIFAYGTTIKKFTIDSTNSPS